MKDIFYEFGQKVGEVADQVGKMTEEAIETQKLKSQIRKLSKNNEEQFVLIGRMIYQQYQNGEILEEKYCNICEEIRVRNQEIDSIRRQL